MEPGPARPAAALAAALRGAGRPVEYRELDGGHRVAPEALRALAALARGLGAAR